MRRLTPLLVLAFLAPCSGGLGQVQPLGTHEGAALDAHREAPGIVWGRSQLDSPLFIPVAQLVSSSGELLPDWFKRGGLQRLEQRIAEARLRNSQTPDNSCFPYTPSGETLDISERRDAAQLKSGPVWLRRISRTDMTVTGRVVKLTPGLNPWTLSPATLVSVRVDSALRNTGQRHAAAGDLITYLTHTGDLTLNGTRFCVTDSNEHPLAVGARVVVSGWVASDRGIHLANRPSQDVIQISGDDSVTVPSTEDGQREVISLKRLVQQVARLAPGRASEDLP